MTEYKIFSAEEFNKRYPKGSRIKYYPIMTDRTRFRMGYTISEAFEMYGNVMVKTDIEAGCLFIRNIEVME